MLPASISTITAPTAEPLTRTEAKLQSRIETTADDALVDALITAAREYAETHTQRALMTQTLEARYVEWPGAADKYEFWIPKPPLVSVTSVKYYDTDGTEQTLATSYYEVDTASAPGMVVIKPSQSWPALQSGKHDPIAIRYVAGYASAAAVPSSIKIGMYMLIAHWYKQRENSAMGNISEVPFGADLLFGQCAAPWGY